MKALLIGCVLAIAALPTTVGAQTVAIAPHLGTLGIGVDGAVALSDAVSVRGGLNIQPYSPEPDIDDITFKLDLPSPTVSGMVDLHPGGGAFRISAGFVYFGSELELDATLDENVDIGDETYTPAEVGTLTGLLVTNSFAPYVGIGVGNAATGQTGFFLDVGLAFHGTPEVELAASGPIASDPDFQVELNKETADINDDVEGVKAYPVVSVGIRLAVR